VKDHGTLSVALALLAKDANELSEREGRVPAPFTDPQDEALVVKSFGAQRFHDDLGQLDVVGHENSVKACLFLWHSKVL